VLLATLITFATLSQNSEVVAMKAAGLSAHQILAPMILTSLLVAAVSFGFTERIVAPATAKLKAWQDVEYAKVPAESGTRTNIWVREGRDLVQARIVSGHGEKTLLQDVRVYQRQNGTLSHVIRADNRQLCRWGLAAGKCPHFRCDCGQPETPARTGGRSRDRARPLQPAEDQRRCAGLLSVASVRLMT
jgi:lipopolysaccharide export system permease protein